LQIWGCLNMKYDTNYTEDMVNSPSHYTQGKYETIDIILDMVKHLPGDQGYLLGNVIKYLARYHFKNGLEDLEKAQKYLSWLAEEVAEHGQN